MKASGVRRSFVEVLLALVTIFSCPALAKQSTTEDPNRYPGGWYRIVLDSNGRYTSGDSQGYEGGTWYSYPATGWYRQWFYDQPYDATGKGHLQYDIYIRAIDTTKPTALEINVNWTTPQWSQSNAKQPPLPKDASTSLQEAQYMLSRGLYRVDNRSLKPAMQTFSFTVEQYNPEWVSIDIRGRNAYVYGGVIRQSDAQRDFGDAPDTYKTLLTNDGARHGVVPGVCLGRTADAEADGKPGPTAHGDDLDEDGVVFTSSLAPGEPVTVEVTASTQGYLNAWVDFNLDGSFAGTGEQIFNDQLLAPGVNRLSFNVPPTAVKGLTYTRFRFSTHGLLSYSGPAADGEVEDYQVAIEERFLPQVNSGKGGLKWSQVPQQFDSTTPFILNGWGQPSGLHLHQVAADDWRCDDDQPITGFQWYGSFEGWTQPAWPQEMPLAFHIAIWTDSAAAKAGEPNAAGHPDTLVWERYCTHWTWNVAGYHSDPRCISDDTDFQFTCLLSQDQWFHPQPAADGAKSVSTVYWLSIAAFYDPNAPTPKHLWGWTTRPHFFNRGAVQIESIGTTDPRSVSWPPALGSQWKSGQSLEVPKGTAWDLAFELLTTQAANSRDPDLSPVYQFRSDKLGDHLYTIDEAEKARLLRDHPDVWTFEGVAFYAYPPDRAPVGSKPVYRFWSDHLSHHFYSIRESEKQKRAGNSAQAWTFEGIAWYAFD